MKEYQDLLANVLENGSPVDDRTGVGTNAIFGEQIKFDLRKGFPIITTKKINFPSVVSELLWFLKGSTNVNELRALRHGEENRFNDTKKMVWDANYEQQGIIEHGYTDIYKNTVCGVLYV